MSRRRRFFFLGCNNVTPVINGDGSATYTFNAATLAAAGQQVPTPTGQIEAMDILIDAREPPMSRHHRRRSAAGPATANTPTRASV